MKRSDYIKTFDNIRCSEEFRQKMEERLSAARTEVHEYADSVTHLERAPSLNAGRIAAAAAIFVLIGGTAGTIYYTATKLPEAGVSQPETEDIINEMPFPELKEGFEASELRAYASISDPDEDYLEESMDSSQLDKVFGFFGGLDWTESEISETYDDTMYMWIEFRINTEEAYVFFMYEDGSARFIKCDGDYSDPSAEYRYQFAPEDFLCLHDVLRRRSLPDEPEPTVAAPKSVSELLDEYCPDDFLKGLTTAGFMTRGGQTGSTITFTFSDMHGLKEKLKSYEWERAESFDYTNVYSTPMGLINEQGYIYLNGENIFRLADMSKAEELVADLKAALEDDHIAELRLLLSKAESSYSTLEADISAYYYTGGVNDFYGYGKLYHSTENEKYYIYCEDQNTFDNIPDPYNVPHILRRAYAITENGESYFIDRATETGEVIADIEYYSPIYPNEEAYIDYFQTYWEADVYLNQYASLPDNKRIKQTYWIDPDRGSTKYLFSGNLYEGEGEEDLTLEVTSDGHIVIFAHQYKRNGKPYYKSIDISNLKFDSPDFAMPDVSIDDLKAQK